MVYNEGIENLSDNLERIQHVKTATTFLIMKESSKDILRILLAILLPPLGVFFQVGLGLHFWINLVLTLLGYIPGIIHGIYIILTRGNGKVSA